MRASACVCCGQGIRHARERARAWVLVGRVGKPRPPFDGRRADADVPGRSVARVTEVEALAGRGALVAGDV